MPVILPNEAWGRWFDPGADVEDLKALLAPAPTGSLTARIVSSCVNSPKHDDLE